MSRAERDAFIDMASSALERRAAEEVEARAELERRVSAAEERARAEAQRARAEAQRANAEAAARAALEERLAQLLAEREGR